MWRPHSRSGAGGVGGSAVRTQRTGAAGEEDPPTPKKSCVVRRETKSLLISPPAERDRERWGEPSLSCSCTSHHPSTPNQNQKVREPVPCKPQRSTSQTQSSGGKAQHRSMSSSVSRVTQHGRRPSLQALCYVEKTPISVESVG